LVLDAEAFAMQMGISGGIHDCTEAGRRNPRLDPGRISDFPAFGRPAPLISAHRDPIPVSSAVITRLLGSACSRLGLGRGLQCLGDWAQADLPQSSLTPWSLG
jgi:hypothetical protein